MNYLKKRGIYFPNFYAQHISGSSDAELSAITGILPCSEVPTMNYHSLSHLPSAIKILKDKGYNAYGLHSNRGSFWNRSVAYKQLGFNYFIDEAFYLGKARGFRSLDHIFFQQSLQMMLNKKIPTESPFLLYFITQTMHGPYPKEKDYFDKTRYTDNALKAFLLNLETNGLLKNTNIIIYGDHTSGIITESYNCGKKNGENVPLIIIPANKKTGTILTYASHIDIAPTILDLAGLPGSNLMLGKSLLKWIPDRLFPIISNSNAVTPMGLVPFKYLINPLYSNAVEYCKSFFYKIKQSNDNSNVLHKHLYIAHALGSIGDISYTNSKEAFLRSYNLGLRLMEVDFSLTKDMRLVCFHYGMKKALNFDKNINMINESEFLSKKYLNKYTPLNLQKLLKLMKQHPDCYVITDFEYNKKETFEVYLSKIVSLTRKYDAKLLKRFVIQIYSPEHLEAVKKNKELKNVILKLYKSTSTSNQIFNFIQKNKNYIKAVTMPLSAIQLNQQFIVNLRKNRIPVFTHTVNNPNSIYNLIKKYIFGFYTDATTELTNPLVYVK